MASIIVFFYVRLLSTQIFLEALHWRSGLNVLFAYRVAMPGKKIVIINRQASDATNSAEIFLLPFRIAYTIRKEVKLCRYSPTY